MAAAALQARAVHVLETLRESFASFEIRDDTQVAFGVGVALAAVIIATLKLRKRSPRSKPETPEARAAREEREVATTQENSERAEKILDHLRRGPHVRSARPEDNAHLPKIIKDVVKEEDWANFDEDAIVRKSKKAAGRLGISEAELRDAVCKAKEHMARAQRGELAADEDGGGRTSLFYILDKLFLVFIVVVGLYLANKEQDGAVFRWLIRAFPKEARVLGFDVDGVVGSALVPLEQEDGGGEDMNEAPLDVAA